MHYHAHLNQDSESIGSVKINYTVCPNLDETKDTNVTQPGTHRRNYRLWLGVKEL